MFLCIPNKVFQYKMIIFFVVANIVFIPITLGVSTTSKLVIGLNATLSPVSSVVPPRNNITADNKTLKETLVSEGGTIIQNAPTLLHYNKTTLSYQELSGDTPVLPSKVKPRKGVDGPIPELKLAENVTVSEKTNVENIPVNQTVLLKNITSVNSTSSTEIKNTSETPRKPLLLTYEAVASADVGKDDGLTVPAIVSSSKTIVSDQTMSPNEENGPTKKVRLMNADRHPGMIMPVVITILVVPMIAVLGYVALKRGQEAWKNRHYKRMDFLLDGMYND